MSPPTGAPAAPTTAVPPLPARPVRVVIDGEPAASYAIAAPSRGRTAQQMRACRVAVIVPCYNRPHDLVRLLSDLSTVDAGRTGSNGAELRIIVVDNASEPPLDLSDLDRTGAAALDLTLLKLPVNTGGSGGFNAGMSHALTALTCGQAAEAGERAPWDPDYLWLVDSDARVLPDTLHHLLLAMERNRHVVVAGSAIAVPPESPEAPLPPAAQAQVFEIGGHVTRSNGKFEPEARGRAGLPGPIDCDYVAACSCLVRSSALRQPGAGLFPDVFLNADDVEWCIRLARAHRGGRGRITGVPDSVAFHPTFDRFPTAPRYYIARNAFGPMVALGLGPMPRLRRAMREVARGVGQAMMGRPDLAALHIRGLRDAAAGRTLGPAKLEFAPPRPLRELGDALAVLPLSRTRPTAIEIGTDLGLSAEEMAVIDAQLAARRLDAGAVRAVRRHGAAALLRNLLRLRPPGGPYPDLAFVPARGRPATWFAGRRIIAFVPGAVGGSATFVVRDVPRLRTLASAATTAIRGTLSAARLALVRPRPSPIPAAPPAPVLDGPAAVPGTVSVIILSYNRWPALRQTIAHLLDRCGLPPASLLVVDNASNDGTPVRVCEHFPGVRLLRLSENLGVEAFNRGAALCDSELLLILDDDARPDPGALHAATGLLLDRPDLGAVTLHPRHPATSQSEWPFAGAAAPATEDRWPVMGCANLVRREAWNRVGGYEARYFLYRNDTDLALKLLRAGLGVHFRPEWTVWHDSPAAAQKSPRWHQLALRNWIWTARRHGGTVSAATGVVLGWAWAHRLAGMSPTRHWWTLQGAWEGLTQPSPTLSGVYKDQGEDEGFARLLRLQLGTRTGGSRKQPVGADRVMVR